MLPSAPDGVCVSATINALSLMVNWSAVDGALSYQLYRSTVPHYGMSLVASVPGLTYYDNPQSDARSLNLWNQYYYAVSTINGSGEGKMSPPYTNFPYDRVKKIEHPVPGLSFWELLE